MPDVSCFLRNFRVISKFSFNSDLSTCRTLPFVVVFVPMEIFVLYQAVLKLSFNAIVFPVNYA